MEKTKNPVMVLAGQKAAKNRKLNKLISDLELRIHRMKCIIQYWSKQGKYDVHVRDAKRDVKWNPLTHFGHRSKIAERGQKSPFWRKKLSEL